MTSEVPDVRQTRAARHALRAGAPSGADPALPTTRPRMVVIASAVVVALAVAAAAATGARVVEVLVVVLAGLVVAAGWPRLTGSRSPLGVGCVLALTAIALGGALLVRDREPYLEHVPAVLALGVIAMCLHPLVQASARVHLASSLAGTALGVLVIGGGGLLISTDFTGSAGPVVVVGIAVAVAALVDLALERPGAARWMIPAGMLVGGLTAVLARWVLQGDVSAWPALLGVTAAGTAVALRRALAQQPAVDTLAGGLAAGAASVLVVAPLVHLVSRLPLT